MEAQYRSVRELFDKSDKTFAVPPYQRGFDWERKEIRDLWLDINRIGDEVSQHFLGNIIFLKEDGTKEYEIVDGQQRITSITLIMLAIRDIRVSDGRPDRRVQDIISSYPDGDEIRRLTLNDENNDTTLDRLYQGATEEAEGPVRDAYDYYRGKISNLDEDEIEQLLTQITDGLKVIETVCRDTSLAYSVFQSQNERGTEVEPHVLVKSRIYGAADQHSKQLGDPDVEQEVVGKWERIYRDLSDKLGGSRWTQDDLRIRRPIAQILLESDTQTPLQIDKSDLYRKFEQVLHAHDNVDSFVDWFDDELEKYFELTSNRYEINSRDLPDQAERWLAYLNTASTHGEALSLAIFNQVDVGEKPNMFTEYCRLAAVIMMRLELGGIPATEKPDILYSVANDVRSVDDQQAIRRILQEAAIDDTPDQGEFVEHLKSNQLGYGGSWQFRVLLTLMSLEEGRRDSTQLRPSSLHIDHIAPRRLMEDQSYARWRRQIEIEKFEDKRNLLGNLTLLDRGDHGEANEASFNDKKNIYANSDIKIAQEVADYDEWTVENIEERTERLAQELHEFWSA